MRSIICICFFIISTTISAQYIKEGYSSSEFLDVIMDESGEILFYGRPYYSYVLDINKSGLDTIIGVSAVANHKVESIGDRTVYLINRSFGLHWSGYSLEMVLVSDSGLERITANNISPTEGGNVENEIFVSSMTLWKDSLALF